MDSVTRRDLARVALIAALPAAAQQQSPADDLAQLREQAKKNSELLRKIKVPIATEPAFSFRP